MNWTLRQCSDILKGINNHSNSTSELKACLVEYQGLTEDKWLISSRAKFAEIDIHSQELVYNWVL